MLSASPKWLGPALGALLVFASPAAAAAPTAVAEPATNVTQTGYVAHATINPQGHADVTYQFAVGSGTGGSPRRALGASDAADHAVTEPLPDAFNWAQALLDADFWRRHPPQYGWVRPPSTIQDSRFPHATDYMVYGGYAGGQGSFYSQFVSVSPPAPTAAIDPASASASFDRSDSHGLVIDGTVALHRQRWGRVGVEIGPTAGYGTLCPAFFERPESPGFTPGSVQASGCGRYQAPADRGALSAFGRRFAGKTIHYRLVADNGFGSGPVYGADRTFTFPDGAAPTPGQITAALTRSLSVSGPQAGIGAILETGAYPATLSAPGAGTEQISWYQVPAGAHIARAKEPVLVASGRKSVTRKGKVKIKVKLTRTGRALLMKVKRHHKLKLTAKGTFAPKRGKTIARKKAFSLKR